MAEQLLGYFRDMMAIRVGCGEDTMLNCTAPDMDHLKSFDSPGVIAEQACWNIQKNNLDCGNGIPGPAKYKGVRCCQAMKEKRP